MLERQKITRRIPAVLATLALVAGPALAQEQEAAEEALISEQAEEHTLSADLIGMPVYTRVETTDSREQIGKIESLLLDSNNRLTGVVVAVGGFLGFGAKSVALDWEVVELEEWGTSGYVANVDMTRQDLEDAPPFKTLARQREEEAARRAREEAERQQQEMQQQQQQYQ